jgi:hypothetical protein
MELTRLRRDIRQVGGEARVEAQTFLDTIDVVREKAEDDLEAALARGCSLDERDIWDFIQENSDHLVREMVRRMPSIGVAGMVAKLVETVGYEHIADALAEWKKADDARVAAQAEALGEFDDYPF